MNAINIFSPLIGFPILYFLICYTGDNLISERFIFISIVFYISYYFGCLIARYKAARYYKPFEFNKLFNIKINARLYKISKICLLVFLSTILIQFIRVGIGHTDTFRAEWIDDIPYGHFIFFPIQILANIFIFLFTIRYLRGDLSPKIFWLFMFICYSILSLLGSRTAFSIPLFIQVSLFYFAQKLSTKQLLLYGGIAFSLMVIIRIISLCYGAESTLNWYLVNGIIDFDDPLHTMKNFMQRSIHDLSWRTHMVINNVPEKFDYTEGYSLFFSYISILPGEQINPTIMLNHNLFHGSDQDVGYPPTLLAQIYMDFGYTGVFIIPSIIGYILMRIYCNVRRHGTLYYGYLYVRMTYAMFLACYGEFLTLQLVFFAIAYKICAHSFKYRSL